MGSEFLLTKEYRRFAEFCDACRRERYIGLCYGSPGVGKTASARQYADWDLVESLLYDYQALARVPGDTTPWRTVLYTPAVANTPRTIDREVANLRLGVFALAQRISKPRETADWTIVSAAEPDLLIIDEADRLKTAGLEQARDMYDRRGGGLVLIGMPGLEKRLARYPQLYSRVGFLHQFHTLSGEELQFILAHQWAGLGLALAPEDFTDAEAMAAVTRITRGNFRLVQRLFAQVDRILQINGLRTVSKEVVEAARENLVIGPL